MRSPLVFTPLLKVRVWGGEILKSRAPNPPEEPVGESWEIADHGDDTTIVADGPHAGRSLQSLFHEHKTLLCGQAIDPSSPEVFPLLLKLIDPKRDLSVQVHPDDAYADSKKPGELGKSEAWYVLSAEPGSRLYRGLKPNTTKAEFAAALENGTVGEVLNSFTVHTGDVVFLPAGTIHALGEGVRIAEIQQNSDTTYRVFDWNRVGLDGKPRELHIEDALAVSNFARDGRDDICIPEALETPGCRHERYIHCAKFAFERLHGFGPGPVALDTAGNRFHILTVVEGAITVKTAEGTVQRERRDTCLIPAAAGVYELAGSADAAVLLFYRP